VTSIVELLRSFWRLFIWWVVIQPWEEGIRVRLGKHRKRLHPGVSFRMPYLDAVYKQSNRLRWTTMTPQTVTTRDGHTLTVSGQLGYRITNIDTLYDRLHQAENGVRSIAQGAIAEYIHTHELNECRPHDVSNGALATLNLGHYGMEADRIQLTTFCRVKTYRLIMDHHENVWEDLLNTSRDDAPSSAPR
jgi:hypothetical protein